MKTTRRSTIATRRRSSKQAWHSLVPSTATMWWQETIWALIRCRTITHTKSAAHRRLTRSKRSLAPLSSKRLAGKALTTVELNWRLVQVRLLNLEIKMNQITRPQLKASTQTKEKPCEIKKRTLRFETFQVLKIWNKRSTGRMECSCTRRQIRKRKLLMIPTCQEKGTLPGDSMLLLIGRPSRRLLRNNSHKLRADSLSPRLWSSQM